MLTRTNWKAGRTATRNHKSPKALLDPQLLEPTNLELKLWVGGHDMPLVKAWRARCGRYIDLRNWKESFNSPRISTT